MATINFPQGPMFDPPGSSNLTLPWFEWFQNPQVSSIVILAPIDVPSGGTGLTSGTSGGILGFTSSTTMASSVSLTASALIVGGGAGATPTPLNSLGTTTTVLHGNAAGDPFWDQIDLSADVSDVLPIANGGTNSGTALASSTVMISQAGQIVEGPTGTLYQLLHSNGAAGVSWSLLDPATDMELPNDPDVFLNGEGQFTTASSPSSWIPLVDGVEPPGFISDGNGSLALVAYTA